MSEEKLIQSQQVTLTGPVACVEEVLDRLHLDAMMFDCTVTLTPTSVPDVTVGVTRDSQQNPRQEQRLRGALTSLRNEVLGVLGIAKEPLRGIIGNTNMAVLRDRLDEAYAALTDAQGSVTEQSQQKSRHEERCDCDWICVCPKK